MRPVNFTGRAVSNVNDDVGTRLSGSSSRSNPTGASKASNESDNADTFAGVQ